MQRIEASTTFGVSKIFMRHPPSRSSLLPRPPAPPPFIKNHETKLFCYARLLPVQVIGLSKGGFLSQQPSQFDDPIDILLQANFSLRPLFLCVANMDLVDRAFIFAWSSEERKQAIRVTGRGQWLIPVSIHATLQFPAVSNLDCYLKVLEM